MGLASERRRHKRFDMTSGGSKLTFVRETSEGLEQENCTLLNLSYSGMCFRACRLMQEGEQCGFLIYLPSPMHGWVLVKALIRWVQVLQTDHCNFGAAFLESSRGWLGPEETTS